jgi:3-oxosteroid 1-dehydrogenase
MQWVPDYSDYYPEAPGGRLGGRSVEPKPFNGKRLGPELANLEPDYGKAPLNVAVTQADYRWLNLVVRHRKGPARVLRVGLRWLAALLGRKHLLGRGQAMAAALRAGLIDAGVPVLLETALVDLQTEAGAVTGVVVEQRGERWVVSARHGVLLASGGFEHNAEMRAQYQRQPIGTQWSVGAPANTGDGIRAGAKLDAALDLMDDAWWGPSIPLSGGPWFCLAERALPGGIMVNARGDGPGENIPAWLIIDQQYRNRYVFAGLTPRQAFPGRWYKAGALVTAQSIAELAKQMGVPADALVATIERFNEFARAGKDEDFSRGESGYDRYYGDPRIKPNPSLAPIARGPFYAVAMVPGDLGTKGGLRTDVDGRVLRADGSVIDGLYAAGNASAPVMGHTYAGPGATIGPAMTFGYLAALHMAARAAQVVQEAATATEEPNRAH